MYTRLGVRKVSASNYYACSVAVNEFIRKNKI